MFWKCHHDAPFWNLKIRFSYQGLKQVVGNDSHLKRHKILEAELACL